MALMPKRVKHRKQQRGRARAPHESAAQLPRRRWHSSEGGPTTRGYVAKQQDPFDV